MLTNVIFIFYGISLTVPELISWKHSFKNLNEELEIAEKKKQALNSLLGAGKISQPTFSLFSHEIDDAMTTIEKQRQALLEKMTSKMIELDEQVRTLEILMANLEIQHVTGEVDDTTYDREADLLTNGLESARKELEAVKDAAYQVSNLAPVAKEEEQNLEPESVVTGEGKEPSATETVPEPDGNPVQTIQCAQTNENQNDASSNGEQSQTQ